MTKVYKSLVEAHSDISAGKVGIIPSDTIYGLVALAADKLAVEHLHRLKYREHKIGTLVAANIDQLVKLGLKRRYLKAVEQYWPGAVSVLIPTGDELSYLHKDKQSLAVRIPDYSDLQALLELTGPLITTSANPPGQKPADNLGEAIHYFADNVDFYVEGGDLSGRPPSTVIRIVDDAIEVLRLGAVKIDEATGRILE